ncbi:tetratricopeptide repeat protein [Gaoshiqia sediminis]|uniref:Tetratricopeptide repeat protein n=1 Tax=Gaoshiqia sediminis TaxID=2986998 RepID=A0AA42C601_9BACT|nr:hypothetical protein [Gaoshiqia sediminis]MCW0482044.1 hypothetical protein [Gaoshiqia sediminis]
MIRKSQYTEYIDKYLSLELTGDELREFNAELAINSDLREEIELHQEIESAMQEKEIASLRNSLQSIMAQEQTEEMEELVHMEHQSYNFDLSEELSSFKEFTNPVNINDIFSFGQSLPILHMAQHKYAEKENIHQFYKEQQKQDVHAEDEFSLTPHDEAIFADIEQAMTEKDILDLRANLQQIAANIPTHERSAQEIEQYIHQELEASTLAEFENELVINQGLARDVELFLEIDQAAAETDIMDLRASLQSIQHTESSTSRKIEEIDQYLSNELSEDELASFESELTNNLDLVAELELYKDIDRAIQETDVMGLREKLDHISKDIIKEKRKERSFVARIPNSRVAIATVAASLILIISITSLISRNKAASNDQLYSQYYETYQAAGIFRSGHATLDNKITLALHQYNDENYPAALQLFNDVLAIDQDNPVGNFYAGMAYQQTGEYNQAITSFESVIKAKNNLFVEQAEWYAGLCFLQTDERKKAFRKFKKIAESNSYYSEKASAILRKMKYIE